MHVYIRRLLLGYSSAVVTLNIDCFPELEQLLSRCLSEPDATASKVIPLLLLAESDRRLRN